MNEREETGKRMLPGRTSINQHIKTHKNDKGTIVQECRYEPRSTFEASMPQDSDVEY